MTIVICNIVGEKKRDWYVVKIKTVPLSKNKQGTKNWQTAIQASSSSGVSRSVQLYLAIC